MYNETKIWQWLKKNSGFNDYAIAAIMGNIEAESAGLPNNVENRCPISDTVYTSSVDDGTYKYWESDAFGYGLCQWTYFSRKRALLSFAKQKGVSIANLEMQLEFMLNEIKTSYKTVYNSLYTAANIMAPCSRFLLEYENPANASSMVNYRNGLSEAIYNRNHTENTEKTETKSVTNPLLDVIANLEEQIKIIKEVISNNE